MLRTSIRVDPFDSQFTSHRIDAELKVNMSIYLLLDDFSKPTMVV
jgi:hypothetical protein